MTPEEVKRRMSSVDKAIEETKGSGNDAIPIIADKLAKIIDWQIKTTHQIEKLQNANDESSVGLIVISFFFTTIFLGDFPKIVTILQGG